MSFMDTFTSLLAGFTIFAVLGNLAHELGVPVQDVVKGGAGLAFVSYPDAIAKFNWVPQVGDTVLCTHYDKQTGLYCWQTSR